MGILKTRLFKPQVKEGVILRSRLLNKMEDNFYKPVHIIVGPAGYGKSVLMSQYLNYCEAQYCWISLDPDCNDVRTFIHYLGTSIQLVSPDSGKKLIEAALANELIQISELGQLIANELELIDQDLVIVLDDYYFICNGEVHDLITEVLRNFPSRHKIAFLSRFDPLLNLHEFYAYDRVNEIRMRDLRFNLEEIKTLSECVTSIKFETEILQKILNISEGWVVPIRLIFKDLLSRNNREIYQWNENTESKKLTYNLLNHLLHQENLWLQEIVILVALFPRFSLSLLKEIYPVMNPSTRQDAEEIEDLFHSFIQRSLFTIPLDEEGEWYRFHHLVQEFLITQSKKKFSEEKIRSALSYGSRLFEREGSIREAIQLAVEAQDFALATEIINRHRIEFTNTQQYAELRQWLRLIPPEVVELSPGLLIIRAVLTEATPNLSQLAKDISKIHHVLAPLNKDSDEQTRYLWGEYYSSKCGLEFHSGNSQLALDAAIKARDLLKAEVYVFSHDYALVHQLLALTTLGRAAEAEIIVQQIESVLKPSQKFHLSHLYMMGIFLRFIQGRVTDFTNVAHQTRDISLEVSNTFVFIVANYYLALSAYLRNELEVVEPYLNAAIDSNYMGRPIWIIHCYQLKCLNLLALDQKAEYAQCLNEMIAFEERYDSSHFKNEVLLYQVNLLLDQGNIKDATSLAKKVNFDSLSFILFYFSPELLEVKLLLNTGSTRDQERAQNLLLEYEKAALERHNQMNLLQVHCLQIQLLLKKKEYQDALNRLRILLAYTEPEGIIRLYTDCGKEMASLFDKLSDDEKNQAYISNIISSFKAAKSAKPSLRSKAGNGLMDKNRLSSKDKAILELISQGYQNKEIADQLNYSLNTIKKYVHKIYLKLDVKNRAEAVYRFDAMKKEYS
jgi:ATP/maltotriose-dependent transcriptional regulator MalT